MSQKNPETLFKKTILIKLPKNKTAAIPVPKDKKATFACVMCGQQFKHHSTLKHHFIQHAEKTIDIRGRPIEQSTLLNYPKKDFTVNMIPCEFCTELLPSISRAIQHKFRKHRFESKNHFCEFCGKLFPIKIALIQHKETAHKNDIIFSTSKDLKTNIKNEKNFDMACKFCAATFATVSALEFHENGVHKFEQSMLLPIYVPPPSTKIRMSNSSEAFSVYYCYLCGSEYIMKYNLRKHLRDHHTDDERNMVPEAGVIRCKTCESYFHSKKAYDAHAIHHRPGDLYVTSEEQRQRVVARVDQDFDYRRVPEILDKCVSNNLQGGRKRVHTDQKPSTAVSTQLAIKIKPEEEPLSPPSSATDSSDDNLI